MGKHARHLLVSCHPEDAHDMHRVMQGLGIHSHFIHWRLNDFMEEAPSLLADGVDYPRLQLWHGFAPPTFPWDTLASLLSSVDWKIEHGITIYVEIELCLNAFSVSGLLRAVRSGNII